jgi:hypothetical protein
MVKSQKQQASNLSLEQQSPGSQGWEWEPLGLALQPLGLGHSRTWGASTRKVPHRPTILIQVEQRDKPADW